MRNSGQGRWLNGYFIVPMHREGAGKISGGDACQDRRLTLPHIAAGSKTFLCQVRTELIGKTYIKKSRKPRHCWISQKFHISRQAKKANFGPVEDKKGLTSFAHPGIGVVSLPPVTR
ncbi:hypothetical protein FQF23_00810 [Escherichia coli]|nr:hypothetical protein [Escherichia coli]